MTTNVISGQTKAADGLWSWRARATIQVISYNRLVAQPISQRVECSAMQDTIGRANRVFLWSPVAGAEALNRADLAQWVSWGRTPSIIC